MRLIDANVLLYAYAPQSQFHARAKTWISDQFNGAETIILPWQTLLAFLRISTNARVFSEPMRSSEAVETVLEWLGFPNVVTIGPGEGHWKTLKEVVSAAQIRGPDFSDAHLATLAIEHGATLCTHDRGFSRFPNLRLLFPLEGS